MLSAPAVACPADASRRRREPARRAHRCDLGADFPQVFVFGHRFAVDRRHDDGGVDAALWTGGAEEVDGVSWQLSRTAGGREPRGARHRSSCPAARRGLHRRTKPRAVCRSQRPAPPRLQASEVQSAQQPADCHLMQGDGEFRLDPPLQINAAPANYPSRSGWSRSSSSAIRLRPHRSGQADFPHPALPESYPHRAARSVQGWVIRGSGRGKRVVTASNQSQPMRRFFWLRRLRQVSQICRT